MCFWKICGLAVLLCTVAGTSACGSTTTYAASDSEAGAAGVAGGPSQGLAGAPSRGGSAGAAGGTAAGLTFAPTNAPAVTLASLAQDALVEGDCTIDSNTGTISCLEIDSEYTAQKVVQSDVDATPAMLFSFNALTLNPNANVSIVGDNPVILLVAGVANIAGLLQATPATFRKGTSLGGGFSSVSGQNRKGGGPGAGGAPDAAGHVGAGGGAYCGRGGNVTGGVAYGTPQIVPLIGGSSGGNGYDQGGAGGGALQIIAGVGITVATTGALHVGGGGAFFGGNGGGSGGAILLEAPSVTIRGTVSANGGAGSSNSINGVDSANGSPDATAAPGGTTTSTSTSGVPLNVGGPGSAAAGIDGGIGQYVESPGGWGGDYGGGGGGGAGRIRINTATGVATVTGTLSPALATTCVTQGALTAR